MELSTSSLFEIPTSFSQPAYDSGMIIIMKGVASDGPRRMCLLGLTHSVPLSTEICEWRPKRIVIAVLQLLATYKGSLSFPFVAVLGSFMVALSFLVKSDWATARELFLLTSVHNHICVIWLFDDDVWDEDGWRSVAGFMDDGVMKNLMNVSLWYQWIFTYTLLWLVFCNLPNEPQFRSCSMNYCKIFALFSMQFARSLFTLNSTGTTAESCHNK